MVTRDQLKRRGLRAYEVGRLRAAARAAWVLVPAVLVCAFATGAGETCACIGVLLLGASIFLRWRNRRGAEAVRFGLLAGAWPLFAGLLVARIAPGCAGAPLVSACTAVCLCVGLPSGVWLGRRLAQGAASASTRLATGGIAGLAARTWLRRTRGGWAHAAFGLAVGAASASVFARTAA